MNRKEKQRKADALRQAKQRERNKERGFVDYRPRVTEHERDMLDIYLQELRQSKTDEIT